MDLNTLPKDSRQPEDWLLTISLTETEVDIVLRALHVYRFRLHPDDRAEFNRAELLQWEIGTAKKEAGK